MHKTKEKKNKVTTDPQFQQLNNLEKQTPYSKQKVDFP